VQCESWHTNTWDEMRFTVVNQQCLDRIGKLYLYFRYELNVLVAKWERNILTYEQ